ncbi:MAG: polyhydroxyalkanoic acid system family protein [Myxococcota bacterium]
MAAIDIRRTHSLGLDTAKQKAEELAKDLSEKLELDWRWEGDAIRFQGDRGKAKGVKGSVNVSSSDVRVEIDLPFLMKAMKGVISGKVEEKLDATLG